MAGAYSTIANDGKYIEPTFYSKIEKRDGKILLKTKQKTKKVFSKEVAYILKEILTQPVIGENGTATYCKIDGVDVAAKTGTTDENYDRWLCGFTPYYSAVAWYGYDQNESIEFNQRNPAGLIWANVMSRIHTGLKSSRFEKPNRVIQVRICSETGEMARSDCPNSYVEYFLWLTDPKLCSLHIGSGLKNNNETNNNKVVTEVIKGITDDIDAIEPPRTDNANTTNDINTTKTDNSTNTTTNKNTVVESQNKTTNNTSVNQNISTFNNSDSASNTNVNTNISTNTSTTTTTKNEVEE